ncbi:MAG: FCD domain-containing protein [Steroidobacteraceae bacterium]
MILRECRRQIGRRNPTRQSFSATDRDFHVAICSASGNPIIRSIASVVETALTPI